MKVRAYETTTDDNKVGTIVRQLPQAGDPAVDGVVTVSVLVTESYKVPDLRGLSILKRSAGAAGGRHHGQRNQGE